MEIILHLVCYPSVTQLHQDSVNCPVGTVLDLLQDRFSAGLSPSTLKVYVAAISAYHTPLGGTSIGRDPLITSFSRWYMRLRTCTALRAPAWDLAIVLEGLALAPFEPIEEVSEKFHTFKTFDLFSLLFHLSEIRRFAYPVGCSFMPRICTWYGESISIP